VSAALVQGNSAQQTKWVAGAARERMEHYQQLTEQVAARNQIIVWPENAITVFRHRIDETYLQPLAEQLGQLGSELILGVPVLTPQSDDYFTTMLVAGSEQPPYAKHHLVPFGEFLPLESLLRGLIDFFNMPMSAFSAGAPDQGPLKIGGQSAAISICYEDLFASELIGQIGRGASIVINGSNNGWYGDSLAPHQHLEIARMFSITTSRPTLRATTSGISAIIDHRGEVVASSRQFEVDVVEGEVTPQQGMTPYSRWGDLPVVLIITMGLIFVTGWGRYSTSLAPRTNQKSG